MYKRSNAHIYFIYSIKTNNIASLYSAPKIPGLCFCLLVLGKLKNMLGLPETTANCQFTLSQTHTHKHTFVPSAHTYVLWDTTLDHVVD